MRVSRFLATSAPARPRLLLVLSLAAGVAGLLSAFGLARSLDTDSLALLPARLPAISALRDSLRLFGSADRVYVLSTPSPGVPDDEAVAALEELARRIPESDLSQVRVRLPLQDLFRRDILPRLPLLLDPDAQDEMLRRLSPEGMAQALRTTRRRIALALTGRERALISMDPLGVAELLGSGTTNTEAGLSLDTETGALRTADGATFVLLAKPALPATDIPFDLSLARHIGEAVAAAAPPEGRVRLEAGGAYLVALSDYRLMTSDLRTNMAVSLVSVALLFIISFRSGRALVAAFVPLGTGILLTFLLVRLSGLRLTSATLGFGAMLVGLGIDFSIVMIGRYAYVRAAGGEIAAALEDTCGSTLRGVATGAITTAASFAALSISAFPALRQLGLVTAMGVLACLLAVALQIPALVAWLLPRPRPISGLGLSRLAPWAASRPRTALGAVLLLTLLLLPGFRRLRLDDDLKSLRSPDNEGVAFEEALARRLGRATDTLVLLVRGATYPALDAALDGALMPLGRLQDEGLVAGAHSIRDVVPSLSVQQARLAHLDARRGDGAFDGPALASRFHAALVAAGFRPDAFDGYLDAVQQGLALDRPLTPETATGSAAMAEMTGDLLVRDGSDWVAQVLVQPAVSRTAAEVRDRLSPLLGGPPGSTTITGFVLAAQGLRTQIRRDAVKVVPLGTVLVAALLWLDFRNVRKVVVSLLPIGLGLVWMLGLMGLLGLTLNFFNVFVLALVQGIGVDYGVHIIHRIEDRGLREVADVGAGVVLAALTTVAGFGSLALSHYPALASMGIVTTFGTAGSLLAALTVIPALAALPKTGAR